jgi:hypothetical protein
VRKVRTTITGSCTGMGFVLKAGNGSEEVSPRNLHGRRVDLDRTFRVGCKCAVADSWVAPRGSVRSAGADLDVTKPLAFPALPLLFYHHQSTCSESQHQLLYGQLPDANGLFQALQSGQILQESSQLGTLSFTITALMQSRPHGPKYAPESHTANLRVKRNVGH